MIAIGALPLVAALTSSTSSESADRGHSIIQVTEEPAIGFWKYYHVIGNMIFWRKIVIYHTKYPNNFRASLRSAQFFKVRPH
jgi:hypothetical protein